MRLRDFLDPSSISLDLRAPTKDLVLDEMVALLGLDERSTLQVSRLLKRREALESTGVGRGLALPHCRSLALNRLRLGFGLHRAGLDYAAVDQRPVHVLFLIVAPPTEVSNQYLPVLGKIAQFAQMPDVPERLRALTDPEQLLRLFEEKGV
ncbi:MAG TPA: PTS sugar transporter subunit IIA [Gemmatimonadales bacterium]|nr:PTS sugar transporter subunit IIA [Gemmatimonadales bacterium]